MTKKDIWINYINWLAESGKIDQQDNLIDSVEENWDLKAFLEASGIGGDVNGENAKEYLGYLLESINISDKIDFLKKAEQEKFVENKKEAAIVVDVLRVDELISGRFVDKAGNESIGYFDDHYNKGTANFIYESIVENIASLQNHLAGVVLGNRVTGDVDYIGLLNNFDEAPVSELMKLPYVFYNKQGEYGTVLHKAVARLSVEQLKRFLSYIPTDIALDYIELEDQDGKNALDVLESIRSQHVKQPITHAKYTQKIALLKQYIEDVKNNNAISLNIAVDTASTHTASVHASVDDSIISVYLHLVKGYPIDKIKNDKKELNSSSKIPGITRRKVRLYNDSVDNPKLEDTLLYQNIEDVDFNPDALLEELGEKIESFRTKDPDNRMILAAETFLQNVRNGSLEPSFHNRTDRKMQMGLTIQQILALCYLATKELELDTDSTLIREMADAQCGYALDKDETDYNPSKNRCDGGTVNSLGRSLKGFLEEIVNIIIITPSVMRSQFGATIRNGIEAHVDSLLASNEELSDDDQKLLLDLLNKHQSNFSINSRSHIKEVIIKEEYDELSESYLSFRGEGDVDNAFSNALQVYKPSAELSRKVESLLSGVDISNYKKTYTQDPEYGYTYNVANHNIVAMTYQKLFSYVRTSENELVRLYEHRGFSEDDVIEKLPDNSISKLITLCKYNVYELIPEVMSDITDEDLISGGKDLWEHVRSAEVLNAILNGRDTKHILNGDPRRNAYTPFENMLHYSNSLEVISQAIELGADLTKQDFDDFFPLYHAAGKCDVELAKLLIEHGADVHVKNSYGTSLHFAARYGNADLVNLLIKNGADVQAKDCYNETPMHWAAKGGNAETAKLLIEQGAKIDVKATPTMLNRGYTPLHKAMRKGHIEIAKLLIENGADAIATDEYDQTSLHIAAIEGHAEAVKLLIEHGVDVAVKDEDGRTPLHFAAVNGYAKVVELLIEQGADVMAMDKYAVTPLHWAARCGKTEAVKAILSFASEEQKLGLLTVTNNNNLTLLHWAAKNGKTEVVSAILNTVSEEQKVNLLSAQVSKGRYENDAPLQIAVKNGNIDVAKLLIEQGADFNVTLGYDGPLFGYAVEKNYVGIVEMLLKQGADFNVEDNHNNTLMESAVWRGYTDIVELFLEYGADVMAMDYYGRTLLHKAVRCHKYDTANLIAKYYYAGINKSLFYSFLTSAVTGIALEHVTHNNSYYNLAAISSASCLFGLGAQYCMRGSYNDYGKYAMVQPLFTAVCTLVAHHYVKDNIQAIVIGNLVTSVMKFAYFQYEMSKYDMSENAL